MNKDLNDKSYNQAPLEDDIDIKEFLKFVLKNKLLIFSFSFSCFFIGIIFALFNEKVWEGQFQIVLKLNKKSSSIPQGFQNLESIGSLAGLDLNLKSSLKTEVGILKSPSVLKPVYEQVNKNYLTNNPNKKFKSFKKWRKDNLKVSLESGTSILNIRYRDNDKKNIIPVLGKMTKIYQDYSGKSKRRGIELTKIYLDDQIKEFQIKSIDSIKKAQDFAIDQDLTILDLNSSSSNAQTNFNSLTSRFLYGGNFQNNTNLGENIGIEVARVKAANRIRTIDIQLKKIEELGDNSQDLNYLSLVMPNLVQEGIPNDLKKIDLKIIQMEAMYTEKFEPLQTLRSKRKLLVELLKKRAIGFLKAARITEEARMESAKRPKGVLLKYKELIREANRDERTLIQLENTLRTVKLEEAKIEDPWQLITTPTLEDIHVAPSKKVYGGIGFIVGFIIGLLFAFKKEQINSSLKKFFKLET